MSVIVFGHLALKGQPLIIVFILDLIGARGFSWHFHISAQGDSEESCRVQIPSEPILQPSFVKTDHHSPSFTSNFWGQSSPPSILSFE